jgi:NADH-ubiquinone oxidoreductase chain 5
LVLYHFYLSHDEVHDEKQTLLPSVLFLYNRFGDLSLIILVFRLFNSNFRLRIILILILSILGKSSLLIFNWWLPMAIEGPTPVSSLLHSSTMVVAGVFLSVKFSILLNNQILSVLITFGLITSLLSRSFALG